MPIMSVPSDIYTQIRIDTHKYRPKDFGGDLCVSMRILYLWKCVLGEVSLTDACIYRYPLSVRYTIPQTT